MQSILCPKTSTTSTQDGCALTAERNVNSVNLSGIRGTSVTVGPNRTAPNPCVDPPHDSTPNQQYESNSSGPDESDCSDSPTTPHYPSIDSTRTFRDSQVSSTGPLQPEQHSATAFLPHSSSESQANPATPRQATHSNPANSQRLTLTDSHGQDYIAACLRYRHKNIKRQLRFLFIYPLVYMLMWVIPFISHSLMYSDHIAHNPPFILSCFVTVIIALQATVDCWLFSTREKPWRYIPGTRGTFWDSFAWWRRREGERAIGKRVSAVGKSTREMEADATDARQRRDEEGLRFKEERRVEKERKESLAGIGSLDKDWWEEERKRRKNIV